MDENEVFTKFVLRKENVVSFAACMKFYRDCAVDVIIEFCRVRGKQRCSCLVEHTISTTATLSEKISLCQIW